MNYDDNAIHVATVETPQTFSTSKIANHKTRTISS